MVCFGMKNMTNECLVTGLVNADRSM